MDRRYQYAIGVTSAFICVVALVYSYVVEIIMLGQDGWSYSGSRYLFSILLIFAGGVWLIHQVVSENLFKYINASQVACAELNLRNIWGSQVAAKVFILALVCLGYLYLGWATYYEAHCKLSA